MIVALYKVLKEKILLNEIGLKKIPRTLKRMLAELNKNVSLPKMQLKMPLKLIYLKS